MTNQQIDRYQAALDKVTAALDSIEQTVILKMAEITTPEIVVAPSDPLYYLEERGANGVFHPNGEPSPYEITETQLHVSVLGGEASITHAIGYTTAGTAFVSRFVGPYSYTFTLPKGIVAISFEVDGVRSERLKLPGWVVEWSLG